MSRISQIMLSDTSQLWEVTGKKVKADAWYGNTDGIHTVSVQYSNFYGGFKIQGTLSLNPTEDDWFDIGLSSITGPGIGPEIRYPRDTTSPTALNGGDTGIDAFTFVGNFTFLRALLVRDYLGSTPASNSEILELDVGAINKVLLSI